ncbi:MAG: DUF115 domain-containing protein, partial [Polyangiaceae bacterium]|nr:DUF115 domain-containing protein [Polyangiaceae bacterium]
MNLTKAIFNDNLEHSCVSEVTLEKISNTALRGRVGRTIDGWPVIVLDEEAQICLDTPFPLPRLDELKADREAKVVVFGLGLGHTVRTLLAAGVEVAAIYEPDPGIARLYFEYGPSDLGEIPVVTSLQELESLWLSVMGVAGMIQVVPTPGYREVFTEELEAVLTRVRLLVDRVAVDDATVRGRGRHWIRDILDNVEFMHQVPSLNQLEGTCRGVPAFIVGAGPSLEKNLALIGKAVGRGVVFAVNSSGRALERAGIVPQFFGCLEC